MDTLIVKNCRQIVYDSEDQVYRCYKTGNTSIDIDGFLDYVRVEDNLIQATFSVEGVKDG
jgi:hypothetical protein